MKRVRVIALLIILCLCSCRAPAQQTPTPGDTQVQASQSQAAADSTAPAPEQNTLPTATVAAPEDPYAFVWWKWKQNHRNQLAGTLDLPGGGLLALWDGRELIEEREGISLSIPFYALYQMEIVNDTPVVKEHPVSGPASESVPIFYDEDWQERSTTLYESNFRWLDYGGEEKALVLICVLPNREQTDTDYQHSELYGLVPTDTLNSSPMEAMKSDWNDGFPAWFFVIEADQITEDYTLQYGDFVLTGKDLLTNTWTIGNAPAMEW